MTVSVAESWNKIQKQLKNTLLKDISPNNFYLNSINHAKIYMTFLVHKKKFKKSFQLLFTLNY